MQLQDTAHPYKPPYRGADWQKIQTKGGRQRGRTVGAQRGAAARLGSSTHFDTYATAVRAYPGPAYLATAKYYGPNGGKIVLRTVHEAPTINGPADEPRPRKHTLGSPRDLADPVNLAKSAARARSEIHDWIRMTATPDRDYRLVTLTKRGGMTYEETTSSIAKLRRQVERYYPDTRMIAVPELHLGDGPNHGTFHVHCLMVFPPGKKPMYSVFHRIWYRALGGSGSEKKGDAPGNVDFAKTHAGDGKRYTPCQAARYLCKYVTKQLLVGYVGQKRYTKTHGAPEPRKLYWWVPIAGNHQLTRAEVVNGLRTYFPADTFAIYSRTFHDGGDTYHVFSAEPVPV